MQILTLFWHFAYVVNHDMLAIKIDNMTLLYSKLIQRNF